MERMIQAEKLLDNWVEYVNSGKIKELLELYSEQATLIPTFSPNIVQGKAGLQNYFKTLSSNESLKVVLSTKENSCVSINENCFILGGNYSFQFKKHGELLTFPSRYTFIIDYNQNEQILHHHSSLLPHIPL